MNVGFGPTTSTRRELLAVRVEEPRGPVQPDRRLAGARPALDDERALRLGRDQPVLVGLDRRHDVAHPPLAPPLQILEQEVRHRSSLERESRRATRRRCRRAAAPRCGSGAAVSRRCGSAGVAV